MVVVVAAGHGYLHRVGILVLGVMAAGDGYWHRFGILASGWLRR